MKTLIRYKICELFDLNIMKRLSWEQIDPAEIDIISKQIDYKYSVILGFAEAINILNDETLTKSEKIKRLKTYIDFDLFYDDLIKMAALSINIKNLVDSRIKAEIPRETICYTGMPKYTLSIFPIIHDSDFKVDENYIYSAKELKQMLDNKKIVFTSIFSRRDYKKINEKEYEQYKKKMIQSFGCTTSKEFEEKVFFQASEKFKDEYIYDSLDKEMVKCFLKELIQKFKKEVAEFKKQTEGLNDSEVLSDKIEEITLSLSI